MTTHNHNDLDPVIRETYNSRLLSQALRSIPDPNELPLSKEEVRKQLAFYKVSVVALEARKLAEPTNELLNRLAQFKAQLTVFYWKLFRINNLPLDILVYIFTLVVDVANLGLTTRTRNSLTAVCSYWRTIAISTPSLWSTVDFPDPYPYPATQLCLTRAKSAPLVLWIDKRDPEWNRTEDRHRFRPEDMEKLMDTVIPALQTARELWILADTWGAILVALGRLRSAPPPPLLERLEMHRTGHPYVMLGPGFVPDDLRRPVGLFGGVAPALKYVCLDGVHVDWARSPLRNLKQIDLRKMAMEVMPCLVDFRNILLGCPELDTLTFVGSGPKWQMDPRAQWTVITLPKLHRLDLSDFAVGYAVFAASLFAAPSLRYLTLDKLNGVDYTPLLKVMTRKFPELRVLTVFSLEVHTTPENDAALARFFLGMPKLRYLRLSKVSNRFVAIMLAILQPGAHNEIRLLPNLTKLEVHNVPFPVVHAFIKARENLGLPLELLLIPSFTEAPFSPTEVETLRSLVPVQIFHPTQRPDVHESYAE